MNGQTQSFFAEDKPCEFEPTYTQAYLVSMKLRGMAHLIECRAEPCSPPHDPKEIQWGIALILDDLALEIRGLAQKMEEQEEHKGAGLSGPIQ